LVNKDDQFYLLVCSSPRPSVTSAILSVMIRRTDQKNMTPWLLSCCGLVAADREY